MVCRARSPVRLIPGSEGLVELKINPALGGGAAGTLKRPILCCSAPVLEAKKNVVVIIHLLGWPGVGKLTVAREMRIQAAPLGVALVVVDNHLTSVPILDVVEADGAGHLPDGTWDHVARIREVVYDAIESLARSETSFVFTNVLVESDLRSAIVVDRLLRLAEVRQTAYAPVLLECRPDEHRVRSSSPARLEKRKWIDAAEILRFAETESLYLPGGTTTVDTTGIEAGEAADLVLERCGIGR